MARRATIQMPAHASQPASLPPPPVPARKRSQTRPLTHEGFRRLACGRSTSPPRTMAPIAPPPFLTDAQFAALPASVQRKYFSPAERLEIVERSAASLSDVNRRPRTAQSPASSTRDPRSRAGSRGRRRLRKKDAAHPDLGISRAEAEWFLSLPDKIIKTCLSREEAHLLALRCEALLIDSDGVSSRFDDSNNLGPIRTPAGKRSTSIQGDSVIDSPQLADEQTATEVSESAPKIDREHVKQPSSRRTLSLPDSFSRVSTSSAPPLPTAIPPSSQESKRPRANTNIAFPRHDIEGAESETKYYQDPEARMKLRLYLASPQKFDEVVEYGFPSTSHVERAPEPSPSEVYIRQASRDVHTFLRGDNMSFLDKSDNEERPDDESSIGDADTPITPMDSEEMFHDATAQAPLPDSNRRIRNMYAQALSGSREMTLRMTLTRPDLRADEDCLYGWQEGAKDDPLALEELPPESDDTTGMQSPFAVHGNRGGGLVRRIMHKVKEKSKQ
ncbi:uncharacterized protein K452DRAFT_294175 [Aplosporella prunicola CBS 121167]|uniref:Mucin n=1 Tax=Aplosporella prunicola CBS 121167 TaxID=1176127 RepID=A0A6A6BR82_9PEZI|nr:uncharacterized protein K452DRAFT_294175 [Aplosporella prunicola CBS 121167]KAF2146622.1 hypothetical protein K452DRAFT_294175 [Aplosporella prunicola CBS 121167]